MKLGSKFAIVLLLLALLAGCGGSGGGNSPRRGDMATNQSVGQSVQITYDHNIVTTMNFKTSLPEKNCLALDQIITLSYELQVPSGWQPMSGTKSTRRYVVDDYDRATDTVTIRLGNEFTSMGRGQSMKALFVESVFSPEGKTRLFSEIGDFFKFSGVDGENPDRFCFEQVGGWKSLYLHTN